MSAKVGERVGAIFSGNKERVQFLGYGVYVGDEAPVGAVGFMADAIRQGGGKNPRIDLDQGYTVWGCECWWGPELAVMQRLQGWMDAGVVIENVDLREIRKSNSASAPPPVAPASISSGGAR